MVCGRIESGKLPLGKTGVMFGPTNFVKETKSVMTPWIELKSKRLHEEEPQKVPPGTIIGLCIKS